RRAARRYGPGSSEALARPALELAPHDLPDDLLRARALLGGPQAQLAPLIRRQAQTHRLDVGVSPLRLGSASFWRCHAAQLITTGSARTPGQASPRAPTTPALRFSRPAPRTGSLRPASCRPGARCRPGL